MPFTAENGNGAAFEPNNVAILDRTVIRIHYDIPSLTVLDDHARIVDDDGAGDIEPVNDLSSRA